MTEFAIRHVEYRVVTDPGPVAMVRQEHKLSVWVNEFFDELWAGDPIYFNFLASDPFHRLHFG